MHSIIGIGFLHDLNMAYRESGGKLHSTSPSSTMAFQANAGTWNAGLSVAVVVAFALESREMVWVTLILRYMELDSG